MLQTIWRWRCAQGPIGVLHSREMEPIYRTFTAGNNSAPVILKINCFLTIAISLGLQLDIHDLYASDTK